ncbi:MAG TPA: hypothetical protein VFE16_14440 [Candidatus Cybelea sp.]|nr:hypothetical protein [Candidatus Cybelea sp.]
MRSRSEAAELADRVERELQAIARRRVRSVDTLPPRLNERANAMARRLKYAIELFIPQRISSTSSIRLYAKWQDPITQTVSEGVISELQEARHW